MTVHWPRSHLPLELIASKYRFPNQTVPDCLLGLVDPMPGARIKWDALRLLCWARKQGTYPRWIRSWKRNRGLNRNGPTGMEEGHFEHKNMNYNEKPSLNICLEKHNVVLNKEEKKEGSKGRLDRKRKGGNQLGATRVHCSRLEMCGQVFWHPPLQEMGAWFSYSWVTIGTMVSTFLPLWIPPSGESSCHAVRNSPERSMWHGSWPQPWPTTWCHLTDPKVR